MTERLYTDSPEQTTFSASVTGVEPYQPQKKGPQVYAVELDRSCFHPEAGGQLADRGTIDGIHVENVIERKGKLLHLMKEVPSTDTTIVCEIDWPHRYDMMQQHTGEHILSGVIARLYGATNNSFRITKETTTIEFNFEHFDETDAAKIEQGCNDAILADTPVTWATYDQEGLRELPLRKQPTVDHDIRVVTIHGCDCVACAGTHVVRTGQVRLFKIIRWEKRNGCYLLEFLCGDRAIRDYQQKNNIINQLIAQLSSPADKLTEAVEKCLSQNKELNHTLIGLQLQMADREIVEIKAAAEDWHGRKLVKWICDGADMNYLKEIAAKMVAEPGWIVLLATGGEPFQIMLNCSDDIPLNFNPIVKPLLPMIGGKGGGRDKYLQGGGTISTAIPAFFEKILTEIKNSLEGEN